MTCELVYRSSAGNLNYWSTNHRFTRKLVDHYQWPSSSALQDDLAALVQSHPTLFASKNLHRFYCLDVESEIEESIDWPAERSTVNPSSRVEKYKPPALIKDGKRYAIALDTNEGRYYLSTVKEVFLHKLGKQVRRWKVQSKAEVTANAIRLNKKLWQKYPGWNPLSNFVVDLQTGKAVWPNADFIEGLVEFKNNPKAVSKGVNDALLDQLFDQLTDHLEHPRRVPLFSQTDTYLLPTIDLQQYNAAKVFEAVAYLIRALGQKTSVDQALKAFDKGILQDFLHTAEIADLATFDSEEYLRQLHQMRIKRREIKDLQILLTALADNLNVEALLKELCQNQSLKSQYYYRNPKYGKSLLKLLRH